jgi:hypothetical protein
MSSSLSPSTTPRVAIIGSGAAGLSAARVFSRQGISPVVLEKEQTVGGVWKYDPDSTKTRPMYRGLRTNLPKEVMAFREKPWPTHVKESYVPHSDVQAYLQEYRQDYQLEQYITYGATVKQLTVLNDQTSQLSPASESWPCIQLEWERDDDDKKESQVFDAVLVCNGHYAQTSVPDLPGLDSFGGETMHSVAYDDPSVFQDKVVLCIGGRASGSDLAREISEYAQHIYVSDTTCPPGDDPATQNKVTWVPKTLGILDGDQIQFQDCSVTPKVDTIIFCSGYDYSFPFVNEQSNLEFSAKEGDRRIMPLYQQLWHAQYPNLAFVGLPHSVVPFPFFELQAEATYGQWNQKPPTTEDQVIMPPSHEERRKLAQEDAVSGGSKGGRIQDTHFLGSGQWDLCRDMAKLAGLYDDQMENYIATNKVRIFENIILFECWMMVARVPYMSACLCVVYACCC